MESNNISKASVLDFATSFGMNNALLKKAYVLSICFVTFMFWIVFPQSNYVAPIIIPGGTNPTPVVYPTPPKEKPKKPKVFIKLSSIVIPDPTPDELEPPSDYTYDDNFEYDATYEGDWLFDPGKGDEGKPVQVAKPECYEKTEPYYPELARKAGIQGTVVVKIIIGTDSRIRNAEILSSPGPQFGFDDAALNAVKQWRCNPTMIDGRKMETEGIVSINFRIRR